MTFAGVCIGGPLAGQTVEYFGSVMRAPIPPADPRDAQVTPLGDPPKAESVKDFTYAHFDMTAYGHDDKEPGSFHFWVDINVPVEQRAQHVISLLLDGYRRSV